MADGITERQRELLDCIRDFIDGEGMSPTVRELAGRVHRSVSTVHKHLRELRDKGYIGLRGSVSRGIVLESRGRGTVIVPILGSIPAGEPVFSEERYSGHIELDASLIPNREVFALKVNGDSMIGANILDGDTAIIHAQNSAESGEIVAALVDGEATLKRLIVEKGKAVLRPENDKYKPIELGEKRGPVRILGRLVAVLRRY